MLTQFGIAGLNFAQLAPERWEAVLLWIKLKRLVFNDLEFWFSCVDELAVLPNSAGALSFSIAWTVKQLSNLQVFEANDL